MSFGGSSSRGKLSEAEEGLGNNVKKALTPDEVLLLHFTRPSRCSIR
jgi:hypothetical protein